MSKNRTIKVNKKKGLLKVVGGDNNNKIATGQETLPIHAIKPENFYMNGELTESRKGNYYGELVYYHEGKWINPIIALPLIKGCRFYTNHIGITTITGNLSSKDFIHRKTVERISKIHKRVETIIENHPMLKSIEGGFPLARFLRRKDTPNGDRVLAISAEIIPTRVYDNRTFDGTLFLNKNEQAMKGNPLSTLKDKEVDAIITIDISYINLSKNRDAIYNKIKAIDILVNEAREIVKTRKVKFSIDFSSDEEDDETKVDEVEENEDDDDFVDDEVLDEVVDEVDDEVDDEGDDEAGDEVDDLFNGDVNEDIEE